MTAPRRAQLAVVPPEAPDAGAGPLVAERAAVGAALHGTAPATTVLQLLQPAHFFDQRLADVLRAVGTVQDRGEQPDLHLVRAELVRSLGPARTHDVDQLLIQLHAEVPLPASARAYCVEVLATSWRRRIAEGAVRLAQAATSSNDDNLHEIVLTEIVAIGQARQEYEQALLKNTATAAADEQEPTA